MNKTYFVTGAQGFVGRYLVAHLLSSAPEGRVIGVGRSPRNDETFTHHIMLGQRNIAAPLPQELQRSSKDSRYQYVDADLLQVPRMVSILERERPQVIFHLASALRDDAVDSLFNINTVGTVRLLEAIAAARLDPVRMVFASSGGVYGIPPADGLPLDESNLGHPHDLYSLSKWTTECAIEMIVRQTQTDVVTGRVFNVLGAGQDERHVCGRIMSQLTAIESGAKTNALQIGSLETTRDFIDARDVATGLHALANRGETGQTYNVASGRETSIQEVLDMSLELTAQKDKTEICHLPPRPADIPRHYGSIARLTALGYEPHFSLCDSLDSILGYYRECWDTYGGETADR